MHIAVWLRGVLSGEYLHRGRLAPLLLAVSMLAAWRGWMDFLRGDGKCLHSGILQFAAS